MIVRIPVNTNVPTILNANLSATGTLANAGEGFNQKTEE